MEFVWIFIEIRIRNIKKLYFYPMFSLFDYNYYTDEFLDTYIHEFNESPFSSCQDDTDDLHKIINGENSFKLNFDFE